MAYEFRYEKFKDINLGDCFFDSLKSDYEGFEDWFKRKAEDYAYIQTIDNDIKGFLYLKIEKGPVEDVNPILSYDRVVKIGTMKIDAQGTRLGERFIKKALDFAIKNEVNYIYVTVFERHDRLINLYQKYGFSIYGSKTTEDGRELVLLKDISKDEIDFRHYYPKVNLNSNAYLLSIYPEFHTRLFPDSILKNEDQDIVENVSHTNSIEKIYICRMKGIETLIQGDVLLIYRTTDIPGQARYRAVATSLCVVDEVRSNRSFASFEDYKQYCKNYSIFSDQELRKLYVDKNEYFTIKMTYNVALQKRIIRKSLIEDIGIKEKDYWGFMRLTRNQLDTILTMGDVSDSYIIR